MRLGGRTAALLALLCACDRDLLPGERILGDEVPAVILQGEAGSRLGAAVAVGRIEGRYLVAISAPVQGRVLLVDEAGQTLFEWEDMSGLGLEIAQDRVYAIEPGEGVLAFAPGGEVELVLSEPGAARLAVCADGQVRTSQDPDAAVACGPEGQDLRTRCEADGSCAVLLDGLQPDQTSPGSDVGFWGELACWGDAALSDDDAPGGLRCQDGQQVDGLRGEHLGRSLSGGRVAGVFDKWIVPARGRIHPLAGGEIWSVDRAAEATDLVLAEGEGLLVVGVPGYAGRDAGEGRVYLVDLALAAQI